jgi:hypothetical protein
MGLGVGMERHAARTQPLEMHDGRGHPFPAETIESPEQDKVELPPAGIFEQLGEGPALLSSLPTTLVLNIFLHDLVPRARTPHHARSSLSWFSGSWPRSSVLTRA